MRRCAEALELFLARGARSLAEEEPPPPPPLLPEFVLLELLAAEDFLTEVNSRWYELKAPPCPLVCSTNTPPEYAADAEEFPPEDVDRPDLDELFPPDRLGH